MDFYWSLRDSKSPQVSRDLLTILAVLSNVAIWMVSTGPPTSKSSCPFYNHLVAVPKRAFGICIIVPFMFHSSFNSQEKVEVLILLLTFFQFYSVVSRDSKVHNFARSVFVFVFLVFFFWFLLGYYEVLSSGWD